MALNNGEFKTGTSLRSRKIFYGWYLVAASWLTTFLVSATSLGLFFKPLLDEFQWERSTLSLVSSVTMLIFAALSPFIGRLIDRFGSRIFMTVSSAMQTASCVIGGFAGGIGDIYASRILYEFKPSHGIQVMINHWFVKKRGRALGLLSTAIPLGQLVLSPVSQHLITTWGWRETFFFWAILTAILAVPLIALARNKPEDKGYLPDGELIPTVSQGMDTLDVTPVEKGLNLGESVMSRPFWLLFISHMICGITCGLLMTHTVIFATDLGYPAIIGATFLSVMGGVSLLGVLVTGVLSDRTSRNRVLSLIHLIRGLSILLLATAVFTGGQSLWLLYLAMTLFGFGWFTTSPLAGGLVADLFGNQRMGTILGIILASHIIGSAIGTYAGGITFQLTGSYLDIFLAAGILECVACVLVFFIRKSVRMKISY